MAKKKVKLLKKKESKVQRFTQIQNIGDNQLSAKQFRLLQRMTHSSKALYNVGLYVIRQQFFSTGKIPSATQIDDAIKADINYFGVQSNSAQAIRRTLLTDIKSYFEGLKGWKKNHSLYTGKPKFPKYKKSTEKRIIEIFQVPKVDENGYWKVPMNVEFRKKFGSIKIKMPKNLRNKKVSYIEIVPKQKGRFFEVHYVYEVQVAQMKKEKTTSEKVLGIDLGVDRLLSCATNFGDTFLIDGKKLKSINRFFNKKIAEVQQQNAENGLSNKIVTNKIAKFWQKRERQINGYISQSIGLLFKQVKKYNIDTIVVGKNDGWKQNINIGKTNNQNFVQIPFNKVTAAIKNKCLKEGIRFVEQEESYTSKASFLDNDLIPTYKKEDETRFIFSGKRIKRGLYQSKNGQILHADINGALNIIRKSSVIEIDSSITIRTPKIVFVQKCKATA